MPKRCNSQSIRIHRSYEIDEAAELLGLTPQTIRAWIKEGLPVLNNRRPFIILGFALKDFVDRRRKKRKQVMALDEFHCLHCKAPRKPLGMMADYFPSNEQRGRLMALCSVCDNTCNRFVKTANLSEISQILEIVIRPLKQD